ncbi:hypothetical protein APR41_18210 [Salegentibacter salinarum]|uniref:Uncharacterized protein n=1 Tax=Salegentibacter salinarum TaxID=447422 RepID=A0A2N0TT99_9FLAO|nr:hypothetical protein [Salegentibacter salinarum]PKD17963.1 hypothetical protein APR41_18210 [Salegentibacter salinarum]SKB99783.1 hypothetical protein SAMN05660903_03719 [Salegentibacter salinarum]
MRLVNLQHTDDAYVAKAEITLKAFGVALGQKSKIYIRKESENAWREKKTNKKVSPREAAHLNKWLSDHQKFVEH